MVAICVLASCQAPPPGSLEALDPTTGAAVAEELRIPPNFLSTTDPALQKWLTEPFEVEYRNMTPTLIFDQPPIADIRYETRNLPEEAPLYHLKSSSMSRREILWDIAEFWHLDMEFSFDERGNPAYVLVTGH
ncbi:MAG: hypothetical protein KDN19_23065 [Verrucomicrobiae bacterium]|nr:hypothetical protein [Verrucomicrobiae bacterium]